MRTIYKIKLFFYLGCVFGLLLSLVSQASFASDFPIVPVFTDQGKSPAELFSETHIEGHPRFVVTIGMGGSGKSHWAKAAKAAGWTVISPDDARIDILKRKQACQEILEDDDGKKHLADPLNTNLLFSRAIRNQGYDETEAFLAQCLAEGKTILWDSMNLSPWRIPMLVQARKAGYWVEALVFESSDPEINIANAAQRSKRGEQDFLPPGTADAERFRRERMYILAGQMRTFPLPDEKIVSWDPSREPSVLPAFQLNLIKPVTADFDIFSENLKANDPDQWRLYNELLKLDVYHAITRVPVLRF